MAAPSYTTDLSLITNAESGTYGEFVNFTTGGTPAAEADYFIEGAGCRSQSFGTKTGAVFSIAFDNGTGITFTAGDCLFIWQICLAGNAIDTFANGGYRVGIGATLTDYNMWKTGGSDFARNPYGGWQNVAVDPTFTPVDYTNGTPGIYRWFGSALNTIAQISKGNPHAIDVLYYGRGELIIELGDLGNGYGIFSGIAVQNDTQTKRWGLFQASGAGYLWKGLMSFGNATNACDFRDTNVDITIDDTPTAYATFNKIEINNASSRVDWTAVNFTAVNPSQLSIGSFEMVDNATVNIDACKFTDMDTFIFQSNASVTASNFIRCGQITHGGAIFNDCILNGYEGTLNTSYIIYNNAADPNGELDDLDITKGTVATHAIELGTSSPLTMTFTGMITDGYNALNGQNDSTFHVKRTSGTVTINIIGGTGNFSYRTDGAIVNIVISPVTLNIVVQDTDGAKIQNARVLATVGSGGSYPFEEVVTITRVTTTASVAHTAHGMVNGDLVVIENTVQNEYNGIKTISNVSTNAYDFTVVGTPTTPATGTIIATTAIISDLTDIDGLVTDTRTYLTDQPLGGRTRKSTTSPFFKTANVVGTVSKDNGLSLTIVMLSDE